MHVVARRGAACKACCVCCLHLHLVAELAQWCDGMPGCPCVSALMAACTCPLFHAVRVKLLPIEGPAFNNNKTGMFQAVLSVLCCHHVAHGSHCLLCIMQRPVRLMPWMYDHNRDIVT